MVIPGAQEWILAGRAGRLAAGGSPSSGETDMKPSALSSAAELHQSHAHTHR